MTGSPGSLPRIMAVFFVLNSLVVIAMVMFEQEITVRYTTDIWPVIFPAAALLALVGAWWMVRRGEAFRAFLFSSATIGLLLVSGGIGLYPNLIISTIDPAYNLTIFYCRGRRQHARRGPGHRADRDAVRAALYGRGLLHLPRQDRRRHARLLGHRWPARPARASARSLPSAACLLRTSGARPLLALGIACGFAAAVLVVAAAYLTSVVVADVFLDGATLPTVAGLLAAVAVLAVVRAPLLVVGDRLAQRAADRLKRRLRADLTAHLLALGPIYTGRERSGELAAVVVNGTETLDAWVTVFEPARILAVAVPLLVLVAIGAVDPPTVLVLLLTGPVLVLLLAFIGGRARVITERRFVELRWLSAFFLDMLQGLPTLKLFGRSAEQVDTIRDISRRYGDTTMEVLRTAFQTSLVLEWGGAVAVALVAVEISLRLMSGAIAFDRALAVLIIVPEFFLPLRTLATRYHAGAAGRTVAERIVAILDEPLPVGPVPEASAASAWSRSTSSRPTPTSGSRGSRRPTPDARCRPLAGLDLTLPFGEVVALVGTTGAGKTTVANLLLRFLEPDAGRILVGDVPLDAIDPGAWRANVAWVPQRPHLFHGTVADNIRLARPAADDAAVRTAAEQAGADAFITDLPLGYDDAGRGGRSAPERRPASARRHRARVPGRCPAGHLRRGDVAPRRDERGRHPGVDRAARAQPDRAGRVAPPPARLGRGSRRRPRWRACRRERESGRAGRPRWSVSPAPDGGRR